MDFKNIDTYRKIHLAIAEWIDAWRLIPRAIAAGYGYMVYIIILWYINLEPYMLENCNIDKLEEACIIEAPTTQHTALITAVFGLAAAIFGFYVKTGRPWNGFVTWNKLMTNRSIKESTQQNKKQCECCKD